MISCSSLLAPPQQLLQQANIQSGAAFSTVGLCTEFHVDCRDVTQEVKTPVDWVKDLQIDFIDAGDQQTQVYTLPAARL